MLVMLYNLNTKMLKEFHVSPKGPFMIISNKKPSLITLMSNTMEQIFPADRAYYCVL